MNVIYAQRPFEVVVKPAIFLAGPTPRSPEVPSWRPEALALAEGMNFNGTLFVPETTGGDTFKNYNAQIQWEWQALDAASVILFWVPRDITTMPAFTTNVEFGLWCRSGKVVLGYPQTAAKMRYLHLLAERENIPIHHTLADSLAAAIKLAKTNLVG